ncbi:MAG: hypothetical protein ACJ76Y_06520 [Thermoanaerobaculia bacterium]
MARQVSPVRRPAAPVVASPRVQPARNPAPPVSRAIPAHPARRPSAVPGAVQAKLRIAGTDEETGRFVTNLNKLLKGHYVATLDDATNELTVAPTKTSGAAPQPIQRLSKLMGRMIRNEQFVTVYPLHGSEHFNVADFENQVIDPEDIETFGNNDAGPGAASVLAHELWEQYHKQVGGADYDAAHAAGIEAEEYVSGLFRIGDFVLSNRDGVRDEVFVFAKRNQVVLSLVTIIGTATGQVRYFDISESDDIVPDGVEADDDFWANATTKDILQRLLQQNRQGFINHITALLAAAM